MPSSIFGNMGQNPIENNVQQIKSMMDLVRSSSYPEQTLQMLLSQNPRYNEVIGLVKKNGGDPKAAFYSLAKEKGVDPDQVLNLLR